MTTSSSTARLLGLLSLLQAGRPWSGPELARRLAVSHRTVRRDVDRLRELGYAIDATPGTDGGYRLDHGRELPPLLFDDDQALALTLALQAATATDAGIEEAALRALTTLKQVMPARLRRRLEALEFTVALPASDAVVPHETLVEISASVRAREVLRFAYERATAPASESLPASPRRVEPHRLVAARGRWYLLAWDLDRDDWRLFRADRMTLRTPRGARFTPRDLPNPDVAAYVSARLKGATAEDRWPCEGTAVLHRPAGEVAPFVPDGVVIPVDADRCEVTSGSWSWTGLAASLARFEADVDVVGPDELRAAFAGLAERAARAASR